MTRPVVRFDGKARLTMAGRPRLGCCCPGGAPAYCANCPEPFANVTVALSGFIGCDACSCIRSAPCEDRPHTHSVAAPSGTFVLPVSDPTPPCTWWREWGPFGSLEVEPACPDECRHLHSHTYSWRVFSASVGFVTDYSVPPPYTAHMAVTTYGHTTHSNPETCTYYTPPSPCADYYCVQFGITRQWTRPCQSLRSGPLTYDDYQAWCEGEPITCQPFGGYMGCPDPCPTAGGGCPPSFHGIHHAGTGSATVWKGPG